MGNSVNKEGEASPSIRARHGEMFENQVRKVTPIGPATPQMHIILRNCIMEDYGLEPTNQKVTMSIDLTQWKKWEDMDITEAIYIDLEQVTEAEANQFVTYMRMMFQTILSPVPTFPTPSGFLKWNLLHVDASRLFRALCDQIQFFQAYTGIVQTLRLSSQFIKWDQRYPSGVFPSKDALKDENIRFGIAESWSVLHQYITQYEQRNNRKTLAPTTQKLEKYQQAKKKVCQPTPLRRSPRLLNKPNTPN